MPRELDFFREIEYQLNQIRYEWRLNPVIYGGSSGSQGGSGAAPGGAIGQVPQRYVAGDTSEDSFLITSGSIGNLLDNLDRIRYWELPSRQFQIEQHSPPTTTFRVSSGSWYYQDCISPLIFAGGETPPITIPTSGSRYDLLTISRTGVLQWTSGSTSGSAPGLPDFPCSTSGSMPLWLVLMRNSGSACVNFDDGLNHYIFRDVRPFFDWGLGSSGSGGGGGTSGSFPVRYGTLASAYQSLPMLRGAWTMNSITESGWVIDLSNQGRSIFPTGTIGNSIINNAINVSTFDGTGIAYYSRNTESGLEVTGGLTLFLWVYFNVADDYFVALKGENSGNFSWRMYTLSNQLYFTISDDSTTEYSVVSSVTPVANTWFFIAARFTPSTELALLVNGTKDVNTSGIPASLFNSTDPIIIPSDSGYGSNSNGMLGPCALCATAIPDMLINDLYNLTRVSFGV